MLDQNLFVFKDQKLRELISNDHSEIHTKPQLIKEFVQDSFNLLPQFPYLFLYDWDVIPGHSQHGKGDLVFADGKGNFAIVQVKYLDFSNTGSTGSSRRTKHRQNLKKQTRRYTEALPEHLKHTNNNLFDIKDIKGYFYTNDDPKPILFISDTVESNTEEANVPTENNKSKGLQIELRDKVLRDFFVGKTWDQNPEFELMRDFVLNSSKLLPNYPFLFEHEWEVVSGESSHGKGDLVFTDGKNAFAVVEMKHVDLLQRKERRREKRRKVEEQAKTYTEKFPLYLQQIGLSFLKIEGFYYTNVVHHLVLQHSIQK
jgi:hypothetical protein